MRTPQTPGTLVRRPGLPLGYAWRALPRLKSMSFVLVCGRVSGFLYTETRGGTRIGVRGTYVILAALPRWPTDRRRSAGASFLPEIPLLPIMCEHHEAPSVVPTHPTIVRNPTVMCPLQEGQQETQDCPTEPPGDEERVAQPVSGARAPLEIVRSLALTTNCRGAPACAPSCATGSEFPRLSCCAP